MKTDRLTNSTPIYISSRRKFLKTAGLASAALFSGLTARNNVTNNLEKLSSLEKLCDFSELPNNFVYLNSGTEGTMPKCVISNLQKNLIKWTSDPTYSYELDRDLGKRQEFNREKVGQFLGEGKNNVCLTDNTTMGLSMAIMGLNLKSTDKVVTTNQEHPSVISPLQIWKARQGLRLEIRSFPPPEEIRSMNHNELLNVLFPNTSALKGAKALCVSHVYPTTGVRLPLKALREKADELKITYLIVDGAQAFGSIDINNVNEGVNNCDFYACSGHKWLNGPPSTGVLYIRNSEIQPPEFYPTFSQRMIRYTEGTNGNSNYPIAKALQIRGCSNTPGFTAMVRAMKFIEDEGGTTVIEKHNLKLSNEVKNFILTNAPNCIITPYTDNNLLSGLTTFYPFKWNQPQIPIKDKKTADWVVATLLERNIQIRSIGIPKPGNLNPTSEKTYALRVSTGYFNSMDEIELLKSSLKDVLKKIN